jgi:ABC-type sugar transport system, periplasmic component
MPTRRSHALAVAVAVTGVAVSLSGCSAPAPEGPVTISFLIPGDETSVALAEAQVAAFEDVEPDITIDIETFDINDLASVPTRLATGEMEDIFIFNASVGNVDKLNGGDSLIDLSGEEFYSAIPESYAEAVSDGEGYYAVPTASTSPFGIFYNKRVFDDLGAEPPSTWEEFFEIAADAKDAGYIPLVQTLGTTFTSQIITVGSFASVLQDDPTWLERFEDGGAASYAESAFGASLAAQQRLLEEGLLNEDFATAVNTDGFAYLANGEAAMYPYLGSLVPGLAASFPDAVDDIGYFPVPDDDPSADPVTVNLGYAIYANKAIEGDAAKVGAVMKFLAFVVSQEGCDIIAAYRLTGPFFQDGCELPADVAPALQDEVSYFGDDTSVTPGAYTLAGPENQIPILVELISGFATAEQTAQKLDDDARAAAQQLGLSGW